MPKGLLNKRYTLTGKGIRDSFFGLPLSLKVFGGFLPVAGMRLVEIRVLIGSKIIFPARSDTSSFWGTGEVLLYERQNETAPHLLSSINSRFSRA